MSYCIPVDGRIFPCTWTIFAPFPQLCHRVDQLCHLVGRLPFQTKLSFHFLKHHFPGFLGLKPGCCRWHIAVPSIRVFSIPVSHLFFCKVCSSRNTFPNFACGFYRVLLQAPAKVLTWVAPNFSAVQITLFQCLFCALRTDPGYSSINGSDFWNLYRQESFLCSVPVCQGLFLPVTYGN